MSGSLAEPNPFEVLGVPIDCDQKAIEESWAKALKRARRQGPYTVEQVNNARQALLSPEKRVEAVLNLFPPGPPVENAPAPLPRELSLDWVEQAFNWRFDEGLRPLASYRPEVELPKSEELWQLYPEFTFRLFKEPFIKWLEHYAEQPEDPWDDRRE